MQRLRYLHYSLRTEEAYVYWARGFVRWSGMRHPRELGAEEVQGYLSMLANERKVSAATHRQALSALLFLYREVLGLEMPWLQELGRPVPKKRLPVVLTQAEVQAVLARLSGVSGLLGRLRDGKGGKDRVVMLPRALDQPLRDQFDTARRYWLADRSGGHAGVYLPHALAAKYVRAAESWAWFWVFPSSVISADPRSQGDGVRRRHHLHEKRLQRDLKAAVEASVIAKPATVPVLPARSTG